MYVSIDLGGTTTRVASSYDLKELNHIEKFETFKSIQEQKTAIKRSIDKVLLGKRPEAVSLGVPGTINKFDRKFLVLPNYPTLDGLPFNSIIPVDLKDIDWYVANDAGIGGLAETIRGSGREFNRILFLTIGTGVGGAFFENKNVNAVYENFEPGHMKLLKNGKSLEDCVSAKGFKDLYNQDPHNCEDSKIWADYSKNLAEGLQVLSGFYLPDIIILGGGVAINNSKFINPKFPGPEVIFSKFGDNAGLIGGLVLLDYELHLNKAFAVSQ